MAVKKCAPMRRSNGCHGLQSSVGFGPHMRGPASARLTRTLRGAYADAPLYNIKFGGSSSSRRRRSTSITNIQCTAFAGCAPIAVCLHLKPCVHLGLHCQMCSLSVSVYDLSPEKALI